MVAFLLIATIIKIIIYNIQWCAKKMTIFTAVDRHYVTFPILVVYINKYANESLMIKLLLSSETFPIL